MKTIYTATLCLFAVVSLCFGSTAQAQLKIDCKSVSERVKTAIEAKPEQVLTIVEDALVAYSGCVDVIVKTAIETSKADAESVKQIVLVAVTTAEKEAPQIAEAAVAAAPDHADAVREAFSEAFEKKNAKSNPDKSKTAAKPVVETSASIGGESVALNQIPAEARAHQAEHNHEQLFPVDVDSSPADTVSGKAVVGTVALDGKGVITDGGKSVIYEDGVNYLDGGKSLAYDDGKSVVYDGKSVIDDGKSVVYDGGYIAPRPHKTEATIGYGPVDLAGVYMIPPIATAAPIVVKELEKVEKVKEVVKTQTRIITKKRTVPLRSIPMSPTSP